MGQNTIAYADCFSGVSGDMLLGALLHAGLDQQFLLQELAKLHLKGLQFTVEEKTVQAISCIKVSVKSDCGQELRTLPIILNILGNSGLDPKVIQQATTVFQLLAAAEAKIHSISIDTVHFHEIGALDTIVDVVGTIVGMHSLGIQRFVCSPLPTGHGFITCAHGQLPIPAPAVCELLKQIPTYGIDLPQELITPTGAALIAGLADDFGPLPPMRITATGYGTGTRVLKNGQPNLLRIITGEGIDVTENQSVEIIETNLDDWNPEGFPYLFELLFNRGALDVNLTPIQMKKGRPGFCLQVISSPALAHSLKETILSETTAIGLRFRSEQRWTLPRKTVQIKTRWGQVKAKQVETPGKMVIYPEYEECRRIAADQNIPLHDVYSEVKLSGTRKNG